MTHHYRDLWTAVFGQVYQVDVAVQQVLKAAMKVPVGQDGFLQSVALDSRHRQLHSNFKTRYNNITFFLWMTSRLL